MYIGGQDHSRVLRVRWPPEDSPFATSASPSPQTHGSAGPLWLDRKIPGPSMQKTALVPADFRRETSKGLHLHLTHGRKTRGQSCRLYRGRRRATDAQTLRDALLWLW